MKKYIQFFNEYLFESDNKELLAGKNIFNSFLKIITASGLKDITPNWDNIPDDFLLFFEYKTDYKSTLDKLERFLSLNTFKDKLPKEDCKLYFGIKNNMTFSFGFINIDKFEQIGMFKINNTSIKYLQLLDSPSASHLKKELAYLNVEKLKTICNITKYIKQYHPGETEKRTFKIVDGLLEFGYKGLGKWNNGVIEDISTIREGFIKYLQNFKGYDFLQMKLNIIDNFIYCIINIK